MIKVLLQCRPPIRSLLSPSWYPPSASSISSWTVVHIVVAEFRTLATRRRLALPFLGVIVLIVVGSGMQPREQRSQDGGGHGGGGGGRIVVKSGAVAVVRLFVAVVSPPVKMADRWKAWTSRLRSLPRSRPRPRRAPTALPPPARRRRHRQTHRRPRRPRPRLCCPSSS